MTEIGKVLRELEVEPLEWPAKRPAGQPKPDAVPEKMPVESETK